MILSPEFHELKLTPAQHLRSGPKLFLPFSMDLGFSVNLINMFRTKKE